jgi:pimeloyl-ACP methyl ester carboxylesterase
VDVDEEGFRRAEQALWAEVGVHPTEAWLRLRRCGVVIRVQELGEGPPVVFVHGASNAGTSWASLAARLDGFRCVLVDRPGCGLSPPLGASLADVTELGAFADDFVVDVLDALAVDAGHVVGTSFGGYFVLRAAAAHQERVVKLVELGWAFGAPVEDTPVVMRIATHPLLGRLLVRVRPTERLVRSMLRQIGLRHAVDSGAFGDVEIAWFLALLRDTDTMRNEIAAAPRVVTLRGFNTETLLAPSLLAQVRAPALFLWGEDDPMGGEAVARRFVNGLAAPELEVLPGAGHAPWIDDLDHVARRVSEFLSR